MSRTNLVLFVFLGQFLLLRGELWEKDMSSAMEIGLSRKGYNSVDLKCGEDYFAVNVTLEKDFQGIVYTRGSFNEKKLPCFKRYNRNTLTRNNKILISLRIPFDKCGTLMDVAESRYTNTLVVQHDPDLIMPGDAAFSLDCTFVPEFKVEDQLNLQELPFKSRITLVDADPSAKPPKAQERSGAEVAASRSDSVSFVPDAGAAKEEL